MLWDAIQVRTVGLSLSDLSGDKFRKVLGQFVAILASLGMFKVCKYLGKVGSAVDSGP